jgi:predicted nucleotidyltransferase
MKSDDISQELAAVLAGIPDIKVAVVFGSLVKGSLRHDSDVDVAVAAEQPLSLLARMRLIEALAVKTGRAVDLIDLQSAGGLILSQALSHGRLVLCRDRLLYASLIRRMLFEQEDTMRYRRQILASRRNAWIGG